LSIVKLEGSGWLRPPRENYAVHSDKSGRTKHIKSSPKNRAFSSAKGGGSGADRTNSFSLAASKIIMERAEGIKLRQVAERPWIFPVHRPWADRTNVTWSTTVVSTWGKATKLGRGIHSNQTVPRRVTLRLKNRGCTREGA